MPRPQGDQRLEHDSCLLLPDFLYMRYPAPFKWLALALVAGAAGQLLKFLGVPAGQFLGPMMVAIVFGTFGAGIQLHPYAFKLGQGCVGILAAHSMTLAVLLSMAQSWPMMLLATAATVCLSALVGLALVWAGIPASTAAWGTAPGAASAMVSMADEYGADSRVVATMQYVRVVCVVMIGALVSHWVGAPTGGETHVTNVEPQSFGLLNLGLTIATLLAGVALGNRVPAGALLMPLLLGGALQISGLLHIALPDWLLATAYGALGCYVGLRFDRPTIGYVWRRLAGDDNGGDAFDRAVRTICLAIGINIGQGLPLDLPGHQPGRARHDGDHSGGHAFRRGTGAGNADPAVVCGHPDRGFCGTADHSFV